MTKTVLVAGATGNLGSAIVKELEARGATVRALVRESKADGGDALRDLAAQRRIELVVGELDDAAALVEHLRGVDVVVSAVQGGRTVVVEGQVNLLRAAEAAGVPRMIPSDFSVNLHALDKSDSLPLSFRKEADEAFEGSPVRPTSVLNGGFMEVMLAATMGIVDLEKASFSFWGDGEQPIDLTAVSDVGAYTAAVALDEAAGSVVSVAGHVLTMLELHAEVEAATDRSLTIRNLGSTTDLKDEIERRKSVATDPFDYIPLQYQWAMVTGKAKLHDLANDFYPDLRPWSVGEFLRRRS